MNCSAREKLLQSDLNCGAVTALETFDGE